MFIPTLEDIQKAQWLRGTRQQQGLYVHQLAAAIDINPGRVSEWENIKKPIPHERYIQLKRVLN